MIGFDELHALFPQAVEIRRKVDLRSGKIDIMMADSEISPRCGFMSSFESEILFNIAEEMVLGRRGERVCWCEIGSHVGWSAAVLAIAGCDVTCVDPEWSIHSTSGVYQRAQENLRRAGVIGSIHPAGMKSEKFFPLLPNGTARFDGILIDGDHDAPQPLLDARRAFNHLKPAGVIVLHDLLGAPIRDAYDWLLGKGFSGEIFDTMNGMAVCRRA